MSRAESAALLSRVLDFVQRDRRLRVGIGVTLIAVLLYFAGRSAWAVVPHHYSLSITGGDIVNNNHYLARILEKQTPKVGVDLVVRPADGGLAALDAVSRGDVDLAFVPGGLDEVFPNVEHVAMVTTEYLHLLVRPGMKTMADLKGRTINLGSRPSATREIALKVASFAGYVRDVDFVETNYSNEQLLALPDSKMPDAIFTVSSVPSYLVELLVKERGYVLMEIAFPQALALRYGWATGGTLFAYTYMVAPPIPERDIETININMYLVANAKVDPAAIEKVLEALYSPTVAGTLRTRFDDTKIATPSGYPMSAATALYQNRNSSAFTQDTWNKLQGVFGLVMAFGGMIIVLIKWFKGPPPRQDYHDQEFLDYMASVVAIEAELGEMEKTALDRTKLVVSRDTLNALRVKVLERYARARLKDVQLFDRCIASVRAAHDRTQSLLDKAAA